MPDIAAKRLPGNTLKGWTSRQSTVLPLSSTPDARDYTFKLDQQISLSTLNGRICVSYQGYDKHTAHMQHSACIGDAKLWYDQRKKQFYLLVS
jgi:hypothetical protein